MRRCAGAIDSESTFEPRGSTGDPRSYHRRAVRADPGPVNEAEQLERYPSGQVVAAMSAAPL